MKGFVSTLIMVAVTMGFGLTDSAEGTLHSRGVALVYDDDLNMTWLKDTTASRGLLTFDEAQALVDELNAGHYLGGSEWRLPTTDLTGSGCTGQFADGLNCTGSELGHMYYIELGNQAGAPPDGGLENRGPFGGLLDASIYWSGTEDAQGDVWFFNFFNGLQDRQPKGLVGYAWLVHDGDLGDGGSGDETLYGVISQNPNRGYLISIDKTTGAATLIGDTGLEWPCALDFNQKNGMLLVSECFDAPPRVYSVDYTDTGETTLAMSDLAAVNAIAYRFVDDFLYTVYNDVNTAILYKLDPVTGELIDTLGMINKGPVDGLAARPSDGVLFGTGYADSLNEHWLFTVNTTSGPPLQETNIGQTNRDITGLAFHPDGTLYATDSTHLLTINPSTGAVTEIGSFGTDIGFVDGLAVVTPPSPGPAGVALLFDTSASMSWSHEGISGVPVSEQRLSLAKEAAYPFMEMLNDHANARVNFGIEVFPPHPWDSSVGCNGQVVTPMTLVDDASTTTSVTTTIPGLVAEGNTPLLAGLDTALGTFGAETPRTIVLLSDGYHNCPPILGAFDPPVDAVIGGLTADSIRVYTIGFGRRTDIDHPLLTRLAADTGGEFYDVTTPTFDPSTWSPATDLQATYKAILVDALGLETAADPMGVVDAGKTVTREVRINEYDRRVSVFLSWQTPQENRLTLRVKTSDGLAIPAAAATPGVSFHQGKTYKIVTLHREFLQSAGKVGQNPWVLEIDAGALDQGEREHYQYSVIVDSGLTMDVAFDKEKYRVGDAIVLQAKLAADRQPMTGLSNVRVRVSRPEDGFGNWFALNKVSKEELEKIPAKRDGEMLSQIQRKAIYLSDVRKIAAPGRLAAGEVKLYDDGTHGDALAGDGVYTNTIADTGKEGTYAFHVHASGPTARGNGFDRDVALHKYLIPRVSAQHIALTAVKLKSEEPKLKRYELIITLRDALGNYLGPRYAGAIALKTEPELALGPLKDNLDGTYSQVLELPENVNVGDVKIRLTAQDAELSFSLGDKVEGPKPPRVFWLVVLVLIVLVFVVFLMWRRGASS